MLGLVPSIHALRRCNQLRRGKDMDGRDKPDHDGKGTAAVFDVRPSSAPAGAPSPIREKGREPLARSSGSYSAARCGVFSVTEIAGRSRPSALASAARTPLP
ncbi:hypothetical protein DWF00_16810 [Bosea caraganae]|uniref:Uncharacterized protein n=1 Tax=Bosea caraganae TaxID=2763117 RepID=A0A370L754_9HYPH|nr:hypothetical protein DWF00_16810 [Bosea caraganae]RDJ25990.1 hypothetical protein DWE98_09030 [Bosea caraganae]